MNTHSTRTDIAISGPSVSPENNLRQYLKEINAIPILNEEEEYTLAKMWIEDKDVNAAHRLVTSHLRLVAKIASKYRGYGLPHEELISEGNIGMMHAVKRFSPNKNARLSTYASWWIKATIQEYILRSWSLVKIATTTQQRKLFFNLKTAKEQIGAFENGDLSIENTQKIAQMLDVSERDVQSMNRRLFSGDLSLNTHKKGDEGETKEWLDFLQSTDISPEAQTIENDELRNRRIMLTNAMTALTTREAEILTARQLTEKPITLEALSQRYEVSKERIRQIENKAFEKLQKSMTSLVAIAHEKDK